MTARTAASHVVATHSSAVDSTASTEANTTAWRVVSAPVTSGRIRVRCMTRSMSRSMTMLKAFADPALMAPPTSVASTVSGSGTPRWARIITGTVVTSSSSMTRGFVSATYARRRRLRGARDGSGPAGAGPPAAVTAVLTGANSM